MFVVIILIVLAVAFLLALAVFVKNSRRKGFDSKQSYYIKSHWIRIIDSFHHDPRHAILDADKILDYALAKKGFEGHLGEKLKKAGSRFSDLNGLWSAHKLRNRIAHEIGDIPVGEAKRALAQFKKGLNDLGAGL